MPKSSPNLPEGLSAPAALRLEDIPQVLHLERMCFSVPWSAEQYASCVNSPRFAIWGCKISGCVRAYVSAAVVVPEIEIFNIAVDPELRGLGIGKLLLGGLLREMGLQGIQRAYLEVRPSNTAARALYGSFGFIVAGLRKNYYPDNGEDALILCLDLVPKL